MSSGFVTEAELEIIRQKRQEEWEKVRRADEPKKLPEEPYDGRSLFERLEASRQKKQEEYDESRKLKNQIRGIDDDEADFLISINVLKSNLSDRIYKEEKKEIQEYRESQIRCKTQLLENSWDSSILKFKNEQMEIKSKSQNSISLKSNSFKRQSDYLKCAVKRKGESVKSESESDFKKRLGALTSLGNYSSSSENDE